MCDYAKFNRMTVEELLQLNGVQSAEMTTRNIDLLIYCLYRSDKNIYDDAEHVTHEQEIIRILEKFNNEQLKQIFNDPRVTYPYRKFLNGITGTMSAILTNSQFILYDYLLERGVDINIENDAYILFYIFLHFNIDIDIDIDIPQQEKLSIENIIRKYKITQPEHPVFTFKFWDKLNYEATYYIDRFSSTDWWNEYHYNINEIILSTEFRKMIPNYEDFGPWESTPEFNKYNVKYNQLNEIKKYFINSNSNRNSNSNMYGGTESILNGGYKAKYLKYKQKYLNLKNNI